MFKQKLAGHFPGNINVTAQRPVHYKPVIIRTFFEGKGKEKQRMYESAEGKIYIADVIDRIFNPIVKFIPKNRRHKGTNANKKMASLL
jgi:hypothetical protein